ncbi:M15 family metallopeptidase [Saccharibacillus sacchari]|uniref:M15 family metallopeptidase n=2 Tax=Saccharibacillus sacchari TaxID=456493 RepID=A0ACC6PAA6_9BACL
MAFFGYVPDVPGEEQGRIIGIHPEVQAKTNDLVAQAADRGIEIVITSDFRSSEEQDRLFRQGREDSGNIVTNARGGQSYHNYGLAIDFALRDGKGGVVWDMEVDRNGNGRPDWMEVVELAKALGFDWGGDWDRFPDYPHFQMDFGYTLRQLQNGKVPKGSQVEAIKTDD